MRVSGLGFAKDELPERCPMRATGGRIVSSNSVIRSSAVKLQPAQGCGGNKTMERSNCVPIHPREELPEREPDFSLMLGGPLYQLYLRTRLARPPLQLLVRRIVDIPLICWLPLLLLAAIEGHLVGGVSVPFLRDVEAQV